MERLQVRIESGVAGVDSQAWDSLVGDGSPFLEHAFLAGLELTGCVGEASGWTPCPVTVWEGEAGVERLVGAAPAYLKTHSFGEFVYDWRLAAWAERQGLPWYPKLVVAVPFTPVTGERLLVGEPPLGTPDAESWRTYVRTALLEGLGALGQRLPSMNVLFPDTPLREELRAQGWQERVQTQFHWRRGEARTFEDYLATLPGKRRNAVRRERREVAERVGIEIVDGSYPGLAGHLADFYASTCERYTGEAGYLNPAFFEHLCSNWRHRVQAVLAFQGPRLIAGTFNVRKGDRLYGRYWGCREEVPFLHFEVAIYRAVEWCLANGVEVFEPGHGGEHKLARGFTPTLVRSWHRHAHPGVARALGDFYAREREAVSEGLQDG
jgi:predicted N-acyltransferase